MKMKKQKTNINLKKENGIVRNIIKELLTISCEFCERDYEYVLQDLCDRKYDGKDILSELNIEY